MKKINVLFNMGIHPQFQEIVDYPPKNVRYYYDKIKGDHNAPITRKKRILYQYINKMGIPRMKFFNTKGINLIHSINYN